MNSLSFIYRKEFSGLFLVIDLLEQSEYSHI